MSDLRITVLKPQNLYRNILLTFHKKCNVEDTISNLIYLESRYPDSYIIVDDGTEIVYSLKNGKTLTTKINYFDLEKYYLNYVDLKNTENFKFRNYYEYTEYTPIRIISGEFKLVDSENVVIFYQPVSALNYVLNILKMRTAFSLDLYISKTLKMSIQKGTLIKYFQGINRQKITTDVGEYFHRLWDEFDKEFVKVKKQFKIMK